MLTQDEKTALLQQMKTQRTDEIINYFTTLIDGNEVAESKLRQDFSLPTASNSTFNLELSPLELLNDLSYSLTDDHFYEDDDWNDDFTFDETQSFEDTIIQLKSYLPKFQRKVVTEPLDATAELVMLTIIQIQMENQLSITDFLKKSIQEAIENLKELDEEMQTRLQQQTLTEFNRLNRKYHWPIPILLLGRLAGLFDSKSNEQVLNQAQSYAITTETREKRNDGFNLFPSVSTSLENLHFQLLLNQGHVETAQKFAEAHFSNELLQENLLVVLKARHDTKAIERLSVNATIANWRKTIITQYRDNQQFGKLAAILEQQLFDFISIDNFLALRNVLIQLGSWEARRDSILTRLTKRANVYSDVPAILAEENALPKLLQVLERYPSADLLRTYGVKVYLTNPKKVTRLFHEVLNKQVANSRTRTDYQHIAQLLDVFAQTGDLGIADQWRQAILTQFPNRPALRDELSRLSF